MDDIEKRILRLEVLAKIALPPHEWVTTAKIKLVRSKLNCSMFEAEDYLVQHFGELPSDWL